MAKTKADLLTQAKTLGLDVTEKNTVAEITKAIKADGNKPVKKSTVVEDKSIEKKEVDEPKLTKAGKHSAKAVREAEAEEARQAKINAVKEGEQEAPAPKKGPVPKTRPLIERRSKAYQAAYKKLDGKIDVSLAEAVELAISSSVTKFDSTVELHVRLAVDPKRAEQNIRDSVVLPAGTGKTIKIAVVATEDDHESAKKAGADLVGEDDLIEEISKGTINFDMLIATPKVMPKLAKLAKTLGPKGLMPSPKSGTVTVNVAGAIADAKKGKVEYRVDPQGIIHMPVGKVSFGGQKLTDNIKTAIDSIVANKPSTLKDTFVISAYLTTTMGPSIRLTI